MKIHALAICLATMLAAAANAETYEFDAGHTEVRFIWDHAGVSTQSGEWRDIKGTVNFDPKKPNDTKVNVTIAADSVSTGVTKLDDHLKSGDFFDSKKYPEIRFVSTGVKQTGKTAVQLTGNLTIKNQTHPVTLDVSLVHMGKHPVGAYIDHYKGEWLGVKATGRVLRSQFDVGRGAPLTSDWIVLEINTEMKAKGS